MVSHRDRLARRPDLPSARGWIERARQGKSAAGQTAHRGEDQLARSLERLHKRKTMVATATTNSTQEVISRHLVSSS